MFKNLKVGIHLGIGFAITLVLLMAITIVKISFALMVLLKTLH